MRSSSILALVAATPSALGAAVKRAPMLDDTGILNYALTLEYLEDKFYAEGLTNYSKADFLAAGFTEAFYTNLQQVSIDEQVHVAYLKAALGDKAVTPATYSFPSKDAASFVALASVLEGVGTSAYLGAAGAITSKAILNVAGSVLAVEARHTSYIRGARSLAPFPKPFDTPLGFRSVFSLAAQFITAGAPNLGITPFPMLALRPSQYPYTAGRSSVTFDNAYKNAMDKGLVTATTKVYAVFYSGLDIYYVPAYISQGNKDYKVEKIPGPDYSAPGQLAPLGQVYVVLSTADGASCQVSDDNVISGVGILEVLPR